MSNGGWLRLPDSGHCPSKGDQEEWGLIRVNSDIDSPIAYNELVFVQLGNRFARPNLLVHARLSECRFIELVVSP